MLCSEMCLHGVYLEGVICCVVKCASHCSRLICVWCVPGGSCVLCSDMCRSLFQVDLWMVCIWRELCAV